MWGWFILTDLGLGHKIGIAASSTFIIRIDHLMEEWEANPFSTLGFIVSVVVKVLISN